MDCSCTCFLSLWAMPLNYLRIWNVLRPTILDTVSRWFFKSVVHLNFFDAVVPSPCSFLTLLSHFPLWLSSLTLLSHSPLSSFDFCFAGVFFYNTHDELNGFIKYGVFEFQRTVGYNDYLSKEYGANFHLSVQYRLDILKSHNFNNNTNKTTLIWWILL